MSIKNPTVSGTHEVKFGNNIVWLDYVDSYTYSETVFNVKRGGMMCIRVSFGTLLNKKDSSLLRW
ncbi:hypothetical protein GCM10023231_18570 [Olivibacter ginsenosidimutans]|uniref:Uncharacterized protein n=1 Tax=Olivibacter ginsenosidimutans TaxID=1176537 RepID=A0ABP9B6I3_9SPHI